MAGYTTEDFFELPVNHAGKAYLLKAVLRQMGYIYRIIIQLDEQDISFERDEEQRWRALADPDSAGSIDAGWFRDIGEALEEAFS